MTTLESELRQELASRQYERDRALAKSMLDNARVDVDPKRYRVILTDQQPAGRQDQQRNEGQNLQAPARSAENQEISGDVAHTARQAVELLRLNRNPYGGSRIILK